MGRWAGAAVIGLLAGRAPGAAAELPAAVPAVNQKLAERIIGQYHTLMERPPGRVPSRDTVDGPLLGNGSLGAVLGGPPEAQKFYLSKNNFWRLKDGHRQGGPRLFGGLDINLPAFTGATYRVAQDIYPALTTSQFTRDGRTVTLRSWVAATADVLLVELSAAGAPADVNLKLWAAPGRGSKQEAGQQGDLLWATKAFYNETNWATQVRPTSAACVLKILGAAPPAFKLEPGRPVTLAVAMQSSFDAPEPLPAARLRADMLNPAGVEKLRAAHAAWWRNFWSRSLVEFGDPLLEKTYYLANYELGSGTRDKDFPAGLFGLWVTSDDPRWAGDYHLNFDFQSEYYGLYAANHLEQADTFEQPVLDFMPRGRRYAQEIFHIRGVYYPVGIGAKGIETSLQPGRNRPGIEQGGVFLGQKCNAAYCLINMAMRWYHTYDLDYAKKVYPFVVAVANFWEDYLRYQPFDQAQGGPSSGGQSNPLAAGFAPTNSTMLPPVVKIGGVPVDQIPVDRLPPGRYVVYNDSIQEMSGPDVNSLLSLGLVYNTFTLALDMSSALGVDRERHAKWRHILKHLSRFPTFERNGETVFRYSEQGTAWIDGNSVGLQHIYPSGAIGLDDDPKLLEIARHTVRQKWCDGNGENSLYPAAVRVGLEPNFILEQLRKLWSGSRKTPNGLPDTMEQCSTVPNTIQEMLCMSHRQMLRLFPVWPKDKDARFWDLRAEGAFLVSSALQGGRVPFVRIYSERGRDCTFVNPWPGQAVEVYRDGRKVEALRGDRPVLKTVAGTTVVLVPEGASCPADAG